MIIVAFLSLDLATGITSKHHNGHSPGLFFLTLVFPAIASLLYLTLVCILVFRKLDEYKSLSEFQKAVSMPHTQTRTTTTSPS